MIFNDSLIQNGTILLSNGSLNLTVNVIAENLTGKLVSETSTWYEAPAFVFPFITSLIAIYSLWLSQLRGAKISLVEPPKIELVELQKKEFDEGYIPCTLPIKRLDLFFVNSGNRDGILKDVRAKVHLGRNVKLYLTESKNINFKYGNNSENFDFLIIFDRSVGHVSINSLYLQITIEINKGSTFKKFYSVEESKNLVEIIDTIFAMQRTNLEQFIEFLDKNDKFGTLEISYKCTGNKYWVLEKIKNEKLDLKIERKYIETVEGYRKLLNDWNNLPPTTEKVISNLIDFLNNRCKIMITQNRDALLLIPGLYSLPNDSFNNLLESFSFEYNLLEKWEKSKIFSVKLYNLIEKMNELTRLYNKALIDPTFRNDWDICRVELFDICVKILTQIDSLVNNLKFISKEYRDREANKKIEYDFIFRWI